jgi:hypothetical protein
MLVRWRLRFARSWWCLGLALGVVATLLTWRYGEGWIASVGASGFVVGIVVLVIAVTVSRDELLDEVIEDVDIDDGYDGDQ